MKLMSIFIALAMLTMLIEGCSRVGDDGNTVGQKLDRVISQTSTAISDAGDSLGSTVGQADTAMSEVASTFSDRALLATLEVGDSAIAASIKTDLARDPDLKARNINVETHDGVVSLNGRACDQEGRERAERIARANTGVVQVRNFLTVKRI